MLEHVAIELLVDALALSRIPEASVCPRRDAADRARLCIAAVVALIEKFQVAITEVMTAACGHKVK